MGFEGLHLGLSFPTPASFLLTLLLGFLPFAFSVLAETSLLLALLLCFLLASLGFLNPTSVKVGG